MGQQTVVDYLWWKKIRECLAFFRYEWIHTGKTKTRLRKLTRDQLTGCSYLLLYTLGFNFQCHRPKSQNWRQFSVGCEKTRHAGMEP